MKDIKVLVLITGQQIIGSIEKVGDFITVESPRMITNPQPGLIDISSFPIGTPSKNIIIKILTKHVIVITDLSKETEKDYLSLVSTLYL